MHGVCCLFLAGILLTRADTGAAGTIHFEPGGVIFWARRRKPAGGSAGGLKSRSGIKQNDTGPGTSVKVSLLPSLGGTTAILVRAQRRSFLDTRGRLTPPIVRRRGWGPPTEAAYQQMKKRTARPRDWSETEKQHLVMLVRGGMSTRAISKALGRRASSVRMMAREMKLILRKKAKRPSV